MACRGTAGMKEALACHEIREGLFQKGYDIPICADMHFQPKVAIKTAEAVEKIRINPGNFADGRKEDESHFKVVIVSESFADKRLVMRHRAVNDALLDESGVLPFHSLSVAAAKTPAEWGMSNAVPASPKCVGGDGRGMPR